MRGFYLKILLFMVAILLLNPASALDLTLEKPLNITHTSSLNLPLEFTSNDNNGTCLFNLERYYYNSATGACGAVLDDIPNVTIPDCNDWAFSVDYDGCYTLNMYAYNTTKMVNDTLNFRVDRTTEFEDGKPFFAAFLIVIFLGLSFLFVSLGKTFQEEGFPLFKSVLAFGAILSGITTVNLAIVSAREYLKFGSAIRMISVYARALEGVFVLVMFIVAALFMFRIVQSWKEGKSLKKLDKKPW